MSALHEYIAAGLALVPIPTGRKGPVVPGWNLREKAITDVQGLHRIVGNVGLAHAWCWPLPTCAVDFDQFDKASDLLVAHGISATALLAADDAVQVVSRRQNRAKLLYRLPQSMESWQTKDGEGSTVLELRCADREGHSKQDVLPPSIHPDTGKPYEWGGMGTFRELPMIPAALLAFWHARLAAPAPRGAMSLGKACEPHEADAALLTDLRSALWAISADDREMWVRIGCALKTIAPQEAARSLWMDWSATSDKFDPADAARVWASFAPSSTNYRVVFSVAQGNGWANPKRGAVPTISSNRADGSDPAPRQAQADRLVELAREFDLFHVSDGTAYATIPVNQHRETHKLRSSSLKQWLTRLFYAETGKAPNSDSTEQAIRVLEAKARFDGPLRSVSLRVASMGGSEYLDLGRPDWSVIEVDRDGWRLAGGGGVAFRRAAGVGSLPVPMPGGSVFRLRRFLNLRSDEDFVLVVAWLCTALRGRGPYPLLVLLGEQGTGKTTFARIVRAIIDPNAAPLRSLPRDDRDLFIAARNGHVLAFDNISAIPDWISDTLCRLATGGGFAVRQLYSDDSETLFNEQRPCILNGIDEVVGRADLADRAVFIALEPIAEAQRKLEADLWAEFDAELPGILGGLLDLVATGIRELPTTVLDGLPRMADFAKWAAACTSTAWGAGRFVAAYSANRQGAARAAAETDALAAAIRDFALAKHGCDGVTVVTLTPSDLLASLDGLADERDREAKSWPATPGALTKRLNRLSPVLRALGISVERTRAAAARKVTLRFDPVLLSRSKSSEEPASSPSLPSLPSSERAGKSEPEVGGPWSARL